MKKIVTGMMALFLALILAACSKNAPIDQDVGKTGGAESWWKTSETTSSSPGAGKVHSHSYSKATCTKPESCSCGATRGSALGHFFSEGKCTRCGAKDSSYQPIPLSKRNALRSAESYLSFGSFSYNGLVEQLEFEKYSHEDAVYAADHCGADWNEQAVKKAKSYLSFSAFSYSGLMNQLEFEGFTSEQAVYAANRCGANWKEQAVKCARNYLDMLSFSRQGLIDQLKFEGFTYEEAVYAVDVIGL